MGTRGIYGFRKNNVDKITYNHFDSYPDGLGAEVVNFCKAIDEQNLSKIYDNIVLINSKEKPTAEQIESCKKWSDLNVSEQSLNDWYCLLRKSQGDLSAYTRGLKYMSDDHDFIKDSLFCEYGYIINLDNSTLEFWVGYQKEPQEGNRYGTETDDNGYYPCKLTHSFPLSDLSEDAIEVMNGSEAE